MKIIGTEAIKLILAGNKIVYSTEFKFHPVRRWRFDFAILDRKVAIEFEGGTWIKGGHVRPAKYAKDCEKYNQAQILGWKVLRYTVDMVRDNPQQIIDDIRNIGGEIHVS